MGAEKAPESPAKDAGAADPIKKTKSECADEKKCWVGDYEKEISTNSYGRYFKKYKADGTEYSYNFSKSYKLYAPVKTGTEITVEAKFKIEKDADVTDEQLASAKEKLEKGVKTYWDNKFSLEADDPECGKKTFKVRYKITWVESGQHYTLKVHKTYPRAGLSGKVLHVSKDKTDWVYAHEFAHCFGLPDEYSYSTDEETVKYVKPDGTLGDPVSAPTVKSKTAADATIMSSSGNTTVLKRHQWYIAIETQELLTAKLGRKIKCDIK